MSIAVQYTMAPEFTHQKKHSRRRKKRRTQDSLSESSSDSDHSDSARESVPSDSKQVPVIASDQPQTENIDDIDMDSETEPAATQELPDSTLKKMEAVQFLAADELPIAEAREAVKRDRKELETAFLAQMATTFANDLDELRQKADFKEKSIVLLAKTLQSGSNMFDDETLEAILAE